MRNSPLAPSLALLCKLGSIAVHMDEACADTAHAFDIIASKALLDDPEVKEWIKAMGIYLPLKRK